MFNSNLENVGDRQDVAPADEEMLSNPLFVRSLAKGFCILQAFRDVNGPMTMRDICEATKLDKSTVQRFCHTLVELGFLIKNAKSKHLSPAPALLDFSFMYLRNDPLIQIATPFLIQARELCGEAFNLARRVDDQVIYVVRLRSPSSRVSDPLIGTRAPLFCTASGRSILSAKSQSEVQEILQQIKMYRLTPMTVCDIAGVEALVDQAREDGYAIADQECIVGEITVASPILDAARKVLGSVNISTSTNEKTVDEVREKLAPVVSSTALQISRSLGLSPFT